jgi:hypothetical protein
MARSPHDSVVDSDPRSWGPASLFNAHRCVMRARGWVNPAPRIVAVASQPADRVAGQRAGAAGLT